MISTITLHDDGRGAIRITALIEDPTEPTGSRRELLRVFGYPLARASGGVFQHLQARNRALTWARTHAAQNGSAPVVACWASTGRRVA